MELLPDLGEKVFKLSLQDIHDSEILMTCRLKPVMLI